MYRSKDGACGCVCMQSKNKQITNPNMSKLAIYDDLLSSVLVLEDEEEESSAEDEQQKTIKQNTTAKPKTFAMGKRPATSLPPPDPITELQSTMSFDELIPGHNLNVKTMTEIFADHPHLRLLLNQQPVCDRAKRKLNTTKKKLTTKRRRPNPNNTVTNSSSTEDVARVKQEPGLGEDGSGRNDVIKLESHLQQSASEVGQHQTQVEYVDPVTSRPPWQVLKFQSLITESPMYVVTNDDDNKTATSYTQAEIGQKCHERQVVLPVLDAVHESRQLQQAGTFYNPDTGRTDPYPACRNGDKCITRRVRFRGQPPCTGEGSVEIIMTSTMFPDELKQFLLYGVLPSSIRPCILCSRELLTNFVTFVKCLNASNRMLGCNHPNYFSFSVPNALQYQMFTNAFDQPGGYYSQYMRRPEPGEVMFEPIATIELSTCEMKQHPDTGRWYLDNSHMHWQPPPLPQPRLGDNVKNFS